MAQASMSPTEVEKITTAPTAASELQGETFIKGVPEEQGDEYANVGSEAPKGQLRRSFKTRHVQMIALGANIGSGVYVSSGKVSKQISCSVELGLIISCRLFVMVQLLAC